MPSQPELTFDLDAIEKLNLGETSPVGHAASSPLLVRFARRRMTQTPMAILGVRTRSICSRQMHPVLRPNLLKQGLSVSEAARLFQRTLPLIRSRHSQLPWTRLMVPSCGCVVLSWKTGGQATRPLARQSMRTSLLSRRGL
jgi:hypothetical protein